MRKLGSLEQWLKNERNKEMKKGKEAHMRWRINVYIKMPYYSACDIRRIKNDY